MNPLLAALSTLLAIELALRLPLRRLLRRIMGTASRSFRVLRSNRISDDWKEKAIPAYSLRLFLDSIRLLPLFLLILSPFLLTAMLAPQGPASYGAFLMRPSVVLAISLGAWLYMKWRPVSHPDYSAGAQMLHRLALGGRPGLETAFSLERQRFLEQAPESDPETARHVFVTGLARAGTTILMRELHASGSFQSLTYAHMPFLLSPNTWRRMVGQTSSASGEERERAHGDGIQVNAQSPEALDEVFWRTFGKADYLKKQGLMPYEPDAESLEAYNQYLRLILLASGGTRYLSKNNNNLLRLPTLAKAYPSSCFLVPIRHPLEHARSLWEQHQRFVHTDRFTQDYMTWLGHHEFGASHRPFLFPGREEISGNPARLDYWLARWMDAYRYLNQLLTPGLENVRWVPYEQLCSDPGLWTKLSAWVELGSDHHPAFHLKTRKVTVPVDAAALADAEDLYHTICRQADAQWG